MPFYHLAPAKQGRNGRCRDLRRLRLNVLNTPNVEEDALHISLRERIGIKVNSDQDGIPFYKSNVMIRDVEGPAIGQSNTKRPEWRLIHSLA
jgi:hypothetical protein